MRVSCVTCIECSGSATGRGRRRLVGRLAYVGVLTLHMLSFGSMQSLVAACPVCRHPGFRHRLRRGRSAAEAQAADTVLLPRVDP